jgi:hypothetical protein
LQAAEAAVDKILAPTYLLAVLVLAVFDRL